MAGLKKARRLKEKQGKQGQYKTADMKPQGMSAAQTSAASANPFVMGTSNYGTPPKG